MKIIRHLSGYTLGIFIFLILIPIGVFQLSKLDYLVNYQMIISSMVLRYVLSVLLLLTGIFFMIWSNIMILFRGKGGPADGFGIAISPRTQQLVTKGPYRLCRNPMAFGIFMIYLSVVLYLNSLFGLAAVLLMVVLFSSYVKTFEEKRLLADFGQDYEEYRKKRPMMIPARIRKKRSDPVL